MTLTLAPRATGPRRPAGTDMRPKPVRVCLVGPSLDILGGQAVQAARLHRRLQGRAALRVDFIPVNPRLPRPFGRMQRIRYLRTVVTSIAYGLALLRRVRNYDVLHVFSASYLSFVLAPLPAMLVGRLLGRRIVLNYRSGEAEDHLRRWRTAVPAMRLADEIVVPSGYLVDVFGRFGLPARAIANFVEVDRIPFRRRATLRPVFLSNRNFEPLYNVACVLRAFALVQQRLPEARLIVVGDGTQRLALRVLAAELGLRHVSFTGQLPPERMHEMYAAADVYLNAPDIDNMPSSVLEAFAAGIPVVTTDAGGIPYIVAQGETGLLVPCGDHEALAASALRLFDEPGLALRLAARAREECLERYQWVHVAAAWEELYLRLARRATRPGPSA